MSHTSADHDRSVELYGVCTTCAVPHARQQVIRKDANVMGGVVTDAWKNKVRRIIVECADELGTFTTDDVWARVPAVNEPRVMGQLMKEIAMSGRIVRTDVTRPSKHHANHSRPVRVWEASAARLPV